MGIFCRKHTNCEESISVIADILSNNNPEKAEEISGKFKSLGYFKVMDLAQATLGKAAEIPLEDDALAQLYGAIETYDDICAKRIESMKLDFERGHYHKVIEKGQAFCKLQPGDPDILLLLSASYFIRGQFESSAQCLFEVKIPDNQPCVEVLNNLATIYLLKGQILRARDYYYTALCLKANYLDCWVNYVETLFMVEDYVTANQSLNMVITYDSDFLPARYACGNLKLALNKPDEALEQFTFAVQSNTRCALSWVNLGNIYLNTNKMSQAVECFERAIEIDSIFIIPRKNLGLAHLKLKQYDSAVNVLTSAIQLCPNDIDVLKILFRAYVSQNKISSAVRLSIICLKHEPDDPDIYYDMGVLYYIHMRNTQVALTYFHKCIELDKDYVPGYKYLIMIYQEQNNHQSAHDVSIKMANMYLRQNDLTNVMGLYYFAFYIFPQCYSTSWKLKNIYKLQLCNNALLRLEKTDIMKHSSALALSDSSFFLENQNPLQEAKESYQEIILQLQLDEIDSISNLISIKNKIVRIDNIIELYNLMAKYSDVSDLFNVHLVLANFFYREFGNLIKAHHHLVKAMNIRDINFDDYITLGKLSLELNKIDEAYKYFHKAFDMDEENTIPRISIGCMYLDQKKYGEAINEFKEVLNIEPNHPVAYSNLLECQLHICDFKNSSETCLNKLKDTVIQLIKDDQVPCLTPQQSLLFKFNPGLCSQIASKYSEQIVKKPYIAKNRGYAHDKSFSNGRIRVGYIYSDLDIYSTIDLIKTIQLSHNKKKFTVFCYSLSPINHSSRAINSIPTNFIDVSNLSPLDVANTINANKIQILVDMNESMGSVAHEVLALRPAPIQAKLLGHPVTSGAKFVDYYITDRICTPPEFKHCFTEKLIYLKRCVCVGVHKILYNKLTKRKTLNSANYKENVIPEDGFQANEAKVLEECSMDTIVLPKDRIIFCNFGQPSYIDESTLIVWLKIFKHIPNFVLWLMGMSIDAQRNILEFFKTNGISDEHITFCALTTKYELLRRIQLADLYLDTTVHSSPKVCLDAMWAGTPVVAYLGDTFSSRMTHSQLTSMGCKYMVARNVNEYVRIAVNLGIYTIVLEEMRQTMWGLKMTNDLFDCRSYVDHLETVYSDIWNQLT